MVGETNDAIVVGAGLAGLTAAIRLAQAGRSVLVLDRCRRAGGRCGTFELDGLRFTIGCNDFGARIDADMKALGVDVAFAPSTNVIDFGDAVYRLPPTPLTALRLLRHLPSIARIVWKIRGGGEKFLGELFDEHQRSGMGFHLVSMLAYALGTPPQDLRADLVRADFSKQYSYGHDRMVVPVGGPQAITDAMVTRMTALGARLSLDTVVGEVRPDGGGFVVATSRGEHRARVVLTTQPPDRPLGRPGLKIAQLLFAVPRSFPFVDARALIVSPPRADVWIRALDEGQWPDTGGFHVFQDCEAGDCRTITGFLLAPRGIEHFDEATRARLLQDVEARLSRHMPGFSSALRFRRLLAPAEWETLHRVGASLSCEIPLPATSAPVAANVPPGLFHIGNTGDPPGDHANAAMLSGLRAAQRAQTHLS
jgi:phytoene dehydrogenase-like protein